MAKMIPRKKILFVAYGGGHSNIMAQVFSSMKHENIDFIALAISTSRIKYDQEKIPYLELSQFANHIDIKNLDTIDAALSSQTFHPQIPAKESLAYYRLNIVDLIEQHGEKVALKMFKEKGRFCFYPINLMRKILKTVNPDLVITTNSPRAEKAAIDAANSLHIKSVCIVDLLTLYEVKGFLSHSKHGSKICVFNERAMELLIENGRPKNEILVTGNPSFDRIFGTHYFELGRVYRKKTNPSDKKIIVWVRSAIEPDKEILEIFEKKLIDFCLSEPDLFLIIRPHPNEPYAKNYSSENIFISYREEDIYVVLHACDIVITFYSTVGIEANLINKPVLQYKNTALFSDFDLIVQNIAFELNNETPLENQLRIQIDRALNSKKTLSSVKAGSATEAVKTVIHSLL